MRKRPAQISVFLALITGMILALFLGVLESARTVANRLSVTVAVNSSIDSLFSQYHQELWKDYRLMGLEQYDFEQLTDEMADFLDPYLENKDWFGTTLEEIILEDVIFLTDGDGKVFEEDALDYMKFGIVAEIWDMADIDLFDKGVPEGTAVDEVSDLYSDDSLDVADIERLIGDITELISESETQAQAAESALQRNEPDVGAFISAAEANIKILGKFPDLIEKYEEAADELKVELEASRSELETKKGDISDELWNSLNEDIEQYESYVNEDGERRQKITALRERSINNIQFLEEKIQRAGEIRDTLKEIERALEQLESSLRQKQSEYASAATDDEAAQAQAEAERIADEIEARERQKEGLLNELRGLMGGYDHLERDFESGIKDEETEGKLESLKAFFSGPDLLELVLPKEPELSKEDLGIGEPLSETFMSTKQSNLGLVDRVYMAFYFGAFFNYFGRGVNDEENEAKESETQTSKEGEEENVKVSDTCEQEYILYGKENDHDNLSEVVKILIAIRSGLNLLYLYTRDSAKKEEARNLALAICGLAGGLATPLVIVIQFLILTVWAMGQAVMDVRHLLAGKKVPFIHDSDSFDLSLEGLLNIADTKSVEGEEGEKDDGKGLSYSDYLKILLFVGHDSEMDYRAMDMIQLALRKDQSDFEMWRMVYSLDATVNLNTAHLFTQSGLVRRFGGVEKEYDLSISTAYSY